MANQSCNDRRLAGVIRGSNMRIRGVPETALGVVRAFQFQFQRPLSYIYDLSDATYYYVEGPSQGQLSLSNVVGPKGTPKMDCSCEPSDIVIDLGNTLCYPDDPEQTDVNYTFIGCLPTSLSGRCTSDDFVVYSDIGYLFSDIR